LATSLYTHPRLGEEVEAISGHYVPQREERIEWDGKELLYLVGYMIVDSSCCGPGGGGYALVPGYVVKWKHTTGDEGLDVSEVEPITSKEEQEEIKRMITGKEKVGQVNFR